MMRLGKLMCLAVTMSLVGCSSVFGGPSSGIELELSSDSQLPQPTFQAIEKAQEGQLPKYNDIRVYDVSSCEQPFCPLMWRIILPDNLGPSQFLYGGQPTFGANTLNSAKQLEPNKEYKLVVGPADKSYHYQRGQLGFKVTGDGKVVPLD